MTDKEQRKRELYIQSIKEATSDGKFKPEEPKKEVQEKITEINFHDDINVNTVVDLFGSDLCAADVELMP